VADEGVAFVQVSRGRSEQRPVDKEQTSAPRVNPVRKSRFLAREK
jgi:hypothetical protein